IRQPGGQIEEFTDTFQTQRYDAATGRLTVVSARDENNYQDIEIRHGRGEFFVDAMTGQLGNRTAYGVMDVNAQFFSTVQLAHDLRNADDLSTVQVAGNGKPLDEIPDAPTQEMLKDPKVKDVYRVALEMQDGQKGYLYIGRTEEGYVSSTVTD